MLNHIIKSRRKIMLALSLYMRYTDLLGQSSMVA